MKINLNEIENFAKGAFQHRIIFDLKHYGEASLKDNIATRKHYNKYVSSFLSLYKRLEKNGLPVKLILGKHGGYWTSKIILKK